MMRSKIIYQWCYFIYEKLSRRIAVPLWARTSLEDKELNTLIWYKAKKYVADNVNDFKLLVVTMDKKKHDKAI